MTMVPGLNAPPNGTISRALEEVASASAKIAEATKAISS
jgi:hypothetical protein